MKTASAAMIAHLAQSSTTLATCMKLKRRDGTIVALTDHDQVLTIDAGDGDGSISYQPIPGFQPSATTYSNDLRADQMEIVGILSSDAVTAADLRAGKYDYAEIKSFLVNWKSLGDGIIKLARYTIGEVRLEEGRYTAEARSMVDRLSQAIGELYTLDCRATLGDARCKVQLNPDTWTTGRTVVKRVTGEGAAPDLGSPSIINTVRPTVQNGFYYRADVAGITGLIQPTWPVTLDGTVVDGTVTWRAIRAYRQRGAVVAVVDQRRFVASGINDPTAASPAGSWWRAITWITGANAGLKRQIISDDGAGALSLRELAELTIAAGDTFEVEVGCDKLLATCRNTFDDLLNLRGEPYIPAARTAFVRPATAAPSLNPIII